MAGSEDYLLAGSNGYTLNCIIGKPADAAADRAYPLVLWVGNQTNNIFCLSEGEENERLSRQRGGDSTVSGRHTTLAYGRRGAWELE